MPVDRKDILKQQDRLASERSREEGAWRELAGMLRPDDRNFSTDSPAQPRDDSDMFDATPLYALDDFAKGLFKQAANPANRWFEFGLVDKDLAKHAPVKHWLWATTNLGYASLSPAVSRFYGAVRPWFANLGCFGWGPLWQEEIVGKGRINDRSLPIGQCYFDVDDEGNLGRFHRVFTLKDHQIAAKWGTVDGVQENRSYKFIHAVYPNPEANPERIGPRHMAYKSCYVCADNLPGFTREGGYEELPVHIPFWNEREGTAYPTGPGHDARADIATLNEMERSNLVMAQFAAEPPVMMRDDSSFTAADIVPNGALYGAMNEQGKPNVGYLNRSEKQVISLQMAEQKRNAIRRAFKFSIAQLIDRPQMTAAEWDGWSQLELEQVAPNLVNIQIGGLSPFLQRRFRILQRAGQLPPPPPELRNASIDIEYVSPLAKAQKIGVARSAIGWVNGALLPIADARPEVLDNLDVDGYARVTHDGMSGVPDLIRDPRQVEATRKLRQQAAADQAQLDQAGQAAAVFADAAHAQQASTLSKQRAGRAQ